MGSLAFDYSNSFIKHHQIVNMKPLIRVCHDLLHNSKGAGRNFTGWLHLPEQYDEEELKRIKQVANTIKANSDALIVIGVGGSYMGSRACIEALNHGFYNQLPKGKRRGPRIYYVGNNMSSNYIWDLMDLLEDLDISINVISKSGTTTEPAIAFRLFKKYMENKYGAKELQKRIYITTDKKQGGLRALAKMEGYTTFDIPGDIGGRYSILTPVGLLPMAVSGINIEELLEGAVEGVNEYLEEDLDKNISYQYALMRNILYTQGRDIELLVSYEPYLKNFAEWWKQLYGESEGKDGKGIYPSSASFTTDLHSIGQLIQDGRRNLFETIINIENPRIDMEVEKEPHDMDGLNYLADKTVNFINKKAFEGTLKAHTQGGIPNLIINLPKLEEYYIGKLIYFFQKSCAISGYMLGINPFDQPGVENYKDNMLRLLGRY